MTTATFVFKPGYHPFARLLRRDGYIVRESALPFSRGMLELADVLVILNAMSENLVGNQGGKPVCPFTEEEIRAVHDWVEQGGSLYLITGHNPYPGSTIDLAASLGIRFLNCGALNTNSEWLIFRREELVPENLPVRYDSDSISYGSGGVLMDKFITEGIDSVATFLGSAFQIDLPHTPVLKFGEGVKCYDAVDEVANVTGYLQEAIFDFGKGRIAVFGNDAMFTAERTRWNSKRGMQNIIAAQKFSVTFKCYAIVDKGWRVIFQFSI